MKGIKTLKQFKKEFQNTDKEKILEMFYNQGIKLISVQNKLENLISFIESNEDINSY